jgi:hypothetical protein
VKSTFGIKVRAHAFPLRVDSDTVAGLHGGQNFPPDGEAVDKFSKRARYPAMMLGVEVQLRHDGLPGAGQELLGALGQVATASGERDHVEDRPSRGHDSGQDREP